MFETPTFDFDEFNDQPRDNRGRLQGDERLHVAFYTRAVENTERSRIEGRKIYEDHDFIRIAIPGDQFNQIDTFATDAYKFRFPNEYKRFKEKTSDIISGTPIEHLPGITVSQAAELKSQHVRTVEDLADMPDSARIMGSQGLKSKAKAFLEVKRDESIALRAEETNNRLKEHELALAQRDAEVAALKAQVEQMLTFSTAKKNKNTEA